MKKFHGVVRVTAVALLILGATAVSAGGKRPARPGAAAIEPNASRMAPQDELLGFDVTCKVYCGPVGGTPDWTGTVENAAACIAKCEELCDTTCTQV